MPKFLKDLDPTLAAALIAAVVSLATTLVALLAAPFRYWIDKLSFRSTLRLQYEQEERKKLAEVIGRYIGRLLEAGESLNHRLWNLYSGEEQQAYLDIGGQYESRHYYLDSTVHRFLCLCVLIRQFEDETLFVDRRYAQKRDLLFVKHLKAMRWVLTDADLFRDIPYDSSHSRDHFFADQLRLICDSVTHEGKLLPRDQLREMAAAGDPVRVRD